MNQIAPTRQILKMTSFKRTRLLSQPGNVLVRSGQFVAASDTVAETNQALSYKLLNIDRLLKVTAKAADGLFQCKPGDRLAQGDLIAGPVGIGRRVIRAKQPCLVILAGEGQVLLEVSQNPLQVKAVFPGVAAVLIPDYGAVIESTGSLIQGIWGNGQTGSGNLLIIGQNPDCHISPEDLNISQRGSIICAGHCRAAEVLRQAEQIMVRGFIFGSMDIDLVSLALSLQVPILLMEGFGEFAINPIAFQLISRHEHKEIALNALQWNAWNGSRPEIFISQSAEQKIPEPNAINEFIPGRLVRIVRADNKGKLGTIVGIQKRASSICGSILPDAEIKLQDNKIVYSSLANLEIIQTS